MGAGSDLPPWYKKILNPHSILNFWVFTNIRGSIHRDTNVISSTVKYKDETSQSETTQIETGQIKTNYHISPPSENYSS